MKNAVAVICEYNPFHNGHKYLIDAAKKASGDAYLIAVMSGNYVQRGEPAIVDKWTRCEAALLGGADAVVEIPSAYAASSAQFFAEAAVDIINKLGVADALFFGSECGDAERLINAAKQKAMPDAAFMDRLKRALDSGLAYPAAMQNALGGEALPPNDILATEYIRALLLSGSAVTPFAIKRCGNVSHTENTLTLSPGSSYTSANALRTLICDMANDLSKLQPTLQVYMPEASAKKITEKLSEQGGPVTLERFESILFATLRTKGPEGIRMLPFVTEGLENKLYTESCKAQTLTELIENCTSTRYTRTRITRILTSILTGAQGNDFPRIRPDMPCQETVHVPYLRLLGIKSTAKPLLSAISSEAEKTGTPFFVGNFPAKPSKALPAYVVNAIQREASATDLYTLGIQNTAMRHAGLEYSTPLIVV